MFEDYFEYDQEVWSWRMPVCLADPASSPMVGFGCENFLNPNSELKTADSIARQSRDRKE
jgi:hypothetical protein